MKHCLGTSTTGASAHAAPVSGFGVHPRETLFWRKYQQSVCKCCLFGVNLRETLSWHKYQRSVCKCCTCPLDFDGFWAHMFKQLVRRLCGIMWHPKKILKLDQRHRDAMIGCKIDVRTHLPTNLFTMMLNDVQRFQ